MKPVLVVENGSVTYSSMSFRTAQEVAVAAFQSGKKVHLEQGDRRLRRWNTLPKVRSAG